MSALFAKNVLIALKMLSKFFNVVITINYICKISSLLVPYKCYMFVHLMDVFQFPTLQSCLYPMTYTS